MGIKIPVLKNFLCCLSLETGGFVLGWLTSILSLTAMILVGFIGITVIIDLNWNGYDSTDSTFYNIFFCVVIGVYFIYVSILLMASMQLIRGTKNRNHFQLKLYLLIMVIGLVLSFIQILFMFFSSGFGYIALNVLYFAIALYLFLCVYSLYEKFKAERLIVHSQYPIQAAQYSIQPSQYPIQTAQYPNQPPQYQFQPPQYQIPQPYPMQPTIITIPMPPPQQKY